MLLALAAVAGGCQPADNAATTAAPGPAAAAESITNFTVRGVVQALREDGKTVVIKHEPVHHPDGSLYMMAMTMPLEARPTNELAGVMVGDLVRFRMRVTRTDGWIDQLAVLGTAKPEPTNAAPADFRILPNVPELKPGDLVPNYTFTNQLGQSIQLADFRGQALAITFIFTRCPFPTFCPRMTDNFNKVMKQLRATPDAPKNWHLLSLSFDPEYDTPETLAGYGRRFGYDPAVWSLATGNFNVIERIAGNFGLYFGRNVSITEQNHNLRTVVIDPEGRVKEVLVGNEWTVEELVTLITQAAGAGR